MANDEKISAGRLIMLQPSSYVDQIKDGHEMTKLPYSYYVHEDGSVGRQDHWQGDPAQVIGFAEDLAVQEVNLLWEDVVEDPQGAVGMYLVTADSKGNFATHPTAISSVEVIEPKAAHERSGA
jgi:hypothetical protein